MPLTLHKASVNLLRSTLEVLKVNCLQYDIVWESPQANQKLIEKLIEKAPKSDLVILPETFNTGFSIKPRMAEEMEGKTMQWLKKLSKKKHTAFIGSLIIKEAESVYNRLVLVEPNGNVQHYNKQHLFHYGSEGKAFTPGESPTIITFQNWRIKPIICYDLRFPVAIRNTENYDLLVCIANWPDSRIEAWDTLLRARAIENQCYVVGVNRVGADGNKLNYCGHSQVFDAMGAPIGESINQSVISATLSTEKLQTIRAKFPFLEDQDTFKLLSK